MYVRSVRKVVTIGILCLLTCQMAAAAGFETVILKDGQRITGEDCFLLRAHVRSVTPLEEVIDQLATYGQTTTSIVQSSPVPARGIDLGSQSEAISASAP